MSLFIREDFISHAGLPLTWKVECDALTDNDYEALAKIVSEKLTFRDVKGIPRGGIPFEKALKPFLNFLGVGEKASTIAVVGVTLGIGFGAGLLIKEVKTGKLHYKDVFGVLVLVVVLVQSH